MTVTTVKPLSFIVLKFLFFLTIAPGETWATVMALLENPTNEQAVSGVALIRGWAFDTQEGVQISTVELFIDSALIGNVPCCSERGDVKDAFPQFSTQNTNNSGWGITFNWGLLNPGVHTVRVEIQNTAGQSLSTETRQVTVLKPGEYEFLDQFSLAKATAKVEGDELVINRITVRDKATQQKKEVDARFRWTEGTQALELTTVVTRSGTLPSQALLSPLTPDPRAELFVATEQASSQVLAVFESPQEGEAVSGVTLIRGWAFAQESDVSIRQVLLSVDGGVPTTVPCCSRRQDVADAYSSSPQALVSGWGITFNFGRLSAGFHTLRIQIEDSTGASLTLTHRVVVVRPGEFEFLDVFDLSAAAAHIQEEEITLTQVMVREKATQQSKVVDIRLRWLQASQSLGITGSVAEGENPSSVAFVFGDLVPADQRQLIQDAVAFATRYLKFETGVSIEQFTVVAEDNLDRLVDAYLQQNHIDPSGRAAIRARWQNQGGEAGFRSFFIYTLSSVWSQSPNVIRFNIIFHEYFHVAQYELYPQDNSIPADQVRAGGPTWLVEGAASYFAFRAMDERGFWNFADQRAGIQRTIRNVSTSLRSMETRAGFTAATAQADLAVIAVDFLTGGSGRLPLAALVTFWDAIGQGMTWQAAFQVAFGKDVETFYNQFDEYRRVNLSPIPYIRGTVTTASGALFAGIHVYACPTVPAICGYAVTAVDGSYAVAVPDGSYTVQFGFTSDGRHPAGFYSTKGFTPDSSKASIIAVTESDVNGINVSIPVSS